MWCTLFDYSMLIIMCVCIIYKNRHYVHYHYHYYHIVICVYECHDYYHVGLLLYCIVVLMCICCLLWFAFSCSYVFNVFSRRLRTRACMRAPNHYPRYDDDAFQAFVQSQVKQR